MAKKGTDRETKASSWSGLTNARNAGATHIRTVWDGHGDDGFFSHELFRNGEPFSFDGDVDSDIEAVTEKHGLIIDGEMNGSVGILEIDLTTGQATFWDAQQAGETQRFAEFLMRCEWEHAESISVEVRFSQGDDDCWDQDVTKFMSTPAGAKEILQPLLERLLYRIDYLEGGEGFLDEVRRQCGSSVALTIDVTARQFVFSGNGKRVSATVPSESLAITRFSIDLR